MTLQALIVDDERLSRLALRQLLETVPDVEIVGECRDVAEAERMFENARVDVVFLDVQMPERSGLTAARQWTANARPRPFIVFVSAFERYALPAFDTEAVDYLTKPVRLARLERALARVRERVRLAGVPPRESPAPIVARIADADVVIPIDRIECIQADGVYAAVWYDQRRVLVRRSLDVLEEQLESSGFARVHRSWLVPLSRIQSVRPTARNRGRTIVLTSGRAIPVSRRKQSALRQMLAR
jgi:two-component system LytT family response regulator